MDSSTIVAARRFLLLLKQSKPSSDRELAQALDELAMAYHQTSEGDPADGDATPPREEYRDRYARLAKRFPDYGNYTVGDWIDPLSKESVIADAIDDLADIEGDLEDAVWRYENVGVDDANWHFRFNFEVHWGRHLRGLSRYLFERIARSDA